MCPEAQVRCHACRHALSASVAAHGARVQTGFAKCEFPTYLGICLSKLLMMITTEHTLLYEWVYSTKGCFVQ